MGKRRCTECNKKLSLLPTFCRCNKPFCDMHKHPEEHECSYDWKKDAPVIQGCKRPKIEKI